MMKKKLHLCFPAVVLMLCGTMASLTSCVNEIDNPAPVVVVDDKPFPYDSEIDYSVTPGDNFYQYALGQWLNSSDPSPSIIKQIKKGNIELTDRMLSNSSDPVVVYLRNQANETMADDSKNKALLNERLQMLEQITTGDQLHKAFQTLCGLGYGTLFRIIPGSYPGRRLGSIIFTGSMTDSIAYAMKYKNQALIEKCVRTYCSYLKAFGFSDERIEQIYENALEIEMIEFEAWVNGIEFLRHPIKKLATRSTEEEDRQKTFEVLAMMGITEEDFAEDKIIYSSDELLGLLNAFVFAGESQEIVLAFRDYMIYNVMAQDQYFVPSANPEATILDMMKGALKSSRCYQYRLTAEEYGYDNIYKQQCNDIMERIRRTFIQRLEKIDWMTDATKVEARKKAEGMKFFIGYPEQWNDQYTPSVNGDCLLASATQLRQDAMSIVKDLRNRSFDDAAWDVWICTSQFITDNAFFNDNVNSLVILPSWITKPRFDNDLSDAALYAVAITFAHEFCHGFDANGSYWDAGGEWRDWWVAADRAAFDAKQEKLIKLFDQLEAYPGQMADGTKTLNENMADYGGVELALDCYKQLLTEQGFKGEQYDEQIKKFFLSYAQIWKNEDENDLDRMKLLYEIDVHSVTHNRVNGMMRLQDDWYRLYNVKPSDKLYVAPEDRVKIW